MKNQKALWAAGLSLALCGPLWAQTQQTDVSARADSGYASYIAARKARLTQTLQRRIDGINRRFSQEMEFKTKLKGERVAFEKKLEKEEESFLNSLLTKDPQQRMDAWSAYYAKTGKERGEFYASLRNESREFWEARMSGAFSAQAPKPPSAKQ
ncbi:MAG: hypothetical protein ACYCPQ_05790 [Elusimicrobiota bacterium]